MFEFGSLFGSPALPNWAIIALVLPLARHAPTHPAIHLPPRLVRFCASRQPISDSREGQICAIFGCPNLDVAFDAGLITFKEIGGIEISNQLKEPEKLGISEKMRVKLLPQHEAYMEFHRIKVYRG